MAEGDVETTKAEDLGPIKRRGCTDVICCIIFILFVLCYSVVCAFAFMYGNPSLLVYPTDSNGDICGVGKYADRPYLYFFDLSRCAMSVSGTLVMGKCPTPEVCVKECPNYFWTSVTSALEEEYWPDDSTNRFREGMICWYGIDSSRASKQSIKSLVTLDECAPYVIPTSPIAGRCVPSFIADLALGVLGNRSLTGTKGEPLQSSSGNNVTLEQLALGSKYMAEFMNMYGLTQRIFRDLVNNWPLLVCGLLFSMLVSLLWIVLLRWITLPMVWITLLSFLGIFAFSTYFTISRYMLLLKKPKQSGNFAFTSVTSYLNSATWFWLTLSILSGVLLLVMFVLIIFLRKRISIAAGLITECSRAIGAMLEILIWPVIPYVLQLGVIVFCVTVCVFLSSVKTAEHVQESYTNSSNSSVNMLGMLPRWLRNSTCKNTVSVSRSSVPVQIVYNSTNSTGLQSGGLLIAEQQLCRFLSYNVMPYVTWMQIFNLFMFFWLFNFVIGWCQMTLAGAFSEFYWTRDKNSLLCCSCRLFWSAWRSFRYHMGSIAFGSLLIALCQTIRAVLEYVQSRLKGKETECAKFCIKCCTCCFWCLEKCLKYISRNAYILIALRGRNFCSAARDAVRLITENFVRAFTLDRVADFVLLVGRLVIVGATASLAYLLFIDDSAAGKVAQFANHTQIFGVNTTAFDAPAQVMGVYKTWKAELNYPIPIMIILILGAYIVAVIFFSVFTMGIETMFLCFLEDLEKNDGSPEKPYYMSSELREILGKKNKKAPKQSSTDAKDGDPVELEKLEEKAEA